MTEGGATAETYVTVSDRRYFVGTVALLNSLRLTGNHGRLLVVDSGLTDGQRALLEPHAQVLRLRPEDRVMHPFLKKALAGRYGAEGVLVFIDGDMIVTGRLGEPLAHARAGRVFAYPNHQSDQDRFFPEWHSIFGLRSPLRRQMYLTAGFVAFSTEHHPTLLRRWEETASAIDPAAIGADHDDPTWAGDQEALNALLMSEVPSDQVAVGRHDEHLWWDAVTESRVEDAASVRVVYNDGDALLLHHAMNPKVWERRAWRRVREDDVYLQLMPRLLYADDLTIRLRGDGQPAWIAPGRRGKAALHALGGANTLAGIVKRRDAAAVRRQVARVVERVLPSLATCTTAAELLTI